KITITEQSGYFYVSRTVEKFHWGLLTPRYWPVWLIIGLLRLSLLLPYPALLWLGKRAGRLIHALAGRRQKLTRYNLAQCFPDKSADEIHSLERAHFEALGIGLFEIALCWWGHTHWLRQRVQIEGMEHLQAALRSGNGALLLSAHVTTLEIGGRLLGLFTPFCLMYRPNNNAALEWAISRSRAKHFERVIPRDDVRQLLRSLKENRVVWYAPDQGFTGKNHVMAPFFNIPAPTNPATSRIARASNAPVLPFYVQRLPGTQGYRLQIDPPLADFPGADPINDATRVNRIIEAQVYLAPEQYLWMHNRFKTRAYREVGAGD
ncbi:MAG TPA: LpxL/LpxP family Kdo(2)-lipid IV(A) lauroyl/palmitoleoyl acyltransferase, partial [Gammaproteobacteria bacterium]|nr:LpxL/LpxP family Kdo(2)-lipid IV(A) lauroyl/palmitoleoyl acyltransferase [Gammaproteobacteria bacterium]